MKHKYIKNVATLNLDQSKCKGCGFCADVCPHQIFSIKDKKAYIAEKDSCMECGACALNCPFGAIEVEAGVGCAIAIINGSRKGKSPHC